MKKIAYVGIDYHINLLSIAVVIEGEKELYRTCECVCHKNLTQI